MANSKHLMSLTPLTSVRLRVWIWNSGLQSVPKRTSSWNKLNEWRLFQLQSFGIWYLFICLHTVGLEAYAERQGNFYRVKLGKTININLVCYGQQSIIKCNIDNVKLKCTRMTTEKSKVNLNSNVGKTVYFYE